MASAGTLSAAAGIKPSPSDSISRLAADALLTRVFGANAASSTPVSLRAGAFSLSSTSSSSSSSSSLSSSTSSSTSASSASSTAEADPTWQEYARILEEDDRERDASLSPDIVDQDSPAPRLGPSDKLAFTSANPLTASLDYAICSTCSRPFLKHVLVKHIRDCLSQAQAVEQQALKGKITSMADSKAKDTIRVHTATGSGSGGGGKDSKSDNAKANRSGGGNDSQSGGAAGGASGAGGGSGGGNGGNDGDKDKKKKDSSSSSKKRKADGADSEKPVSKKKKQTVKAVPKPKGPVDVERQCGVPLPNGGFCARSLTCKSHSMGAKRNVPGRSQPYDVLLAAYQKKNQLKQAALTSSAQLAEDMELANGPVDSDEEVESVMDGVHRSFPVPLERKVVMPVRIKHQFFRMREMFASAFSRPI
ncbi:SCA7, zinc-binding domain-containing protein [Myxozyma melibiosi]|uniref:SCA7, zinc-binding domain-containing protein n=1 Tax=Myxozyma melibiosi TaxID=54550 RepID=A0ABR1FCD3_9ASCO